MATAAKGGISQIRERRFRGLTPYYGTGPRFETDLGAMPAVTMSEGGRAAGSGRADASGAFGKGREARMIEMLRIAALVAALALIPVAAMAEGLVYKLYADGLACPFCAYGIEKKLSAVEGVERLDIDIDGGVVTVHMAEGAQLDEATARKAVKDAGFSLRRFEQAGE